MNFRDIKMHGTAIKKKVAFIFPEYNVLTNSNIHLY